MSVLRFSENPVPGHPPCVVVDAAGSLCLWKDYQELREECARLRKQSQSDAEQLALAQTGGLLAINPNILRKLEDENARALSDWNRRHVPEPTEAERFAMAKGLRDFLASAPLDEQVRYPGSVLEYYECAIRAAIAAIRGTT